MLGYLPLGLLILSVRLVAAADNDQGALDLLNNSQGQTPCQVCDQLQEPCQQDGNSANGTLAVHINQSVSQCTCNTVLYNLWSACAYQNFQSPNSSFQTWVDSCQQHNVGVTWMSYPMQDDIDSTNIPKWAYMNVTSDYTFNLPAAVAGDPGWTLSQKLIPVVVGVSLLVVFGILFLVYHRKRVRQRVLNKAPTPTRASRRSLWLPRLSRVRSSRKYGPWSAGDVENTAASLDSRSRDHKHHVRLASNAPLVTGSPSKPMKQGRESLWRNPWRRSIIPVISLPPRRGFRIDDTDLSTQGGGSRRSTLQPNVGENNELATEQVSLDGRGTPESVQERVSLIRSQHVNPGDEYDSDSEDGSVLLISRHPGVDFSVRSSDFRSTKMSDHFTYPTPAPSSPLMPSPTTFPPTVTSHSPHSSPILPNPHPESPPSIPSIAVSSPLRPAALPEHIRTASADSFVRLAHDDPALLFPASVRAAGYSGVPRAHSHSHSHSHSRNLSADSMYTHDPMTPPPPMY